MSETEGRHHPSFTYPVFRRPTGKVQFRVDGPEVVTVTLGSRSYLVSRGEVIAAKSVETANALCDGGQFAHVDPAAPVGKE